ncbi:MAG TPA: GTPase Era [Actinomycetota bacterium]|nr:GTPase Era [Actinomycetota bacterium]
MSTTQNAFRSGFVALVGRPNVGKSTLLNAFIGRKVAITSKRPQTTRNAIRGVLTGDDYQIIFVDTPGLHKPKSLLGERLNDVVHRTLVEVDAIVFMVDATQPVGHGDEFVARAVLAAGTPAICVVNKSDIAKEAQMFPQLEAATDLGDWREIVPVSAVRGTNVDTLQRLLADLLPEGPKFYPDDMVSDQPRDVLLAELIREKALHVTRQEVPHSIAVVTDETIEREDGILEIRATIFVERDSQKGIVIGKGGSMLKEIGTRAREDLEWLMGTKVFLQLHVKVAKEWQRDPRALERLGY